MSKDFEYYCDKSTELLQRLEKELDEEKAYIASKGAGAIFSYAAEYVQKCDVIESLDSTFGFCSENIKPPISIKSIEFLLSYKKSALNKIMNYFEFYMDNDAWNEFHACAIQAVEASFQKEGVEHE